MEVSIAEAGVSLQASVAGRVAGGITILEVPLRRQGSLSFEAMPVRKSRTFARYGSGSVSDPWQHLNSTVSERTLRDNRCSLGLELRCFLCAELRTALVCCGD